jgi:predicted translin family RNA/ssDNA-binding protein
MVNERQIYLSKIVFVKTSLCYITAYTQKGELNMKVTLIFVFAIIAAYPAAIMAQNTQTSKTNINSEQEQNPLETIAREITKISKSVSSLNARLKNFSETFSSKQGLSFTERQQKLLVAFEFLNCAEERLAVLQKLKIDLTEKQSSVRVQLTKINDDIRPEGIDRSVVLRGTTNAEELREIRRQFLSKEKLPNQRL